MVRELIGQTMHHAGWIRTNPFTIDRHFEIYIAIIYTHAWWLDKRWCILCESNLDDCVEIGSSRRGNDIDSLLIKQPQYVRQFSIFISFYIIAVNLYARPGGRVHARWHWQHFTLYLAPDCFRERGLLDINATLKCQSVADRRKSRLAISVLSFSVYY